jgi:thiol:disulfide interchange protein DsbD
MLKFDYVIASLYVDDFTKLPKEEQFFSEESGIDIETIGERNYDFEQSSFGVQSQPYYVLIDPYTGKKLVDQPIGYVSSVTQYLDYLEKGVKKFAELHPEKVKD